MLNFYHAITTLIKILKQIFFSVFTSPTKSTFTKLMSFAFLVIVIICIFEVQYCHFLRKYSRRFPYQVLYNLLFILFFHRKGLMRFIKSNATIQQLLLQLIPDIFFSPSNSSANYMNVIFSPTSFRFFSFPFITEQTTVILSLGK